MAGFLWKPQSESNNNSVFMAPSTYNARLRGVKMLDKSGRELGAGAWQGFGVGGRGQWGFDQPGTAYPEGSYLQMLFRDGSTQNLDLGTPWKRAEGKAMFGGDSGDPFAGAGVLGGGNSGDSLALPGGIAKPEDLSGLFPKFQAIHFPSIDAADYTKIDPQEFMKAFGEFNTEQFSKNFGKAQEFALGALDTELQGLKNFAPAAAALSREQITLDNLFNQANRTAQVRAALPGVRESLAEQAKRAEQYARGEIPNAITDRAMDLKSASEAADVGTFAGFGAKSMQTQKLADLMSADDRLKIAQYGENLLGQNISAKAGLFLAPTEYSQAGSQIKVMPEVGAGRLTYQGASMLNSATMIDPGAALTSKINQEQFDTNLEQRTNEFNATGIFNAAQYNSAGKFRANLGLFNYQVAYADAVTAANQGVLNNVGSMMMQGEQGTAFNSTMGAAQDAQTIRSTLSGIGAIPGAASAINGVANDLGFGSASTGDIGGAAPSAGNVSGTSTAPGDYQVGPSTLTYPSDASVPYSFKIASSTPTPAGYAPVSYNGDGSRSVVNIDGYRSELDRFAKSSGIEPGKITIQAAAATDRNVSNALALSYVPTPGFAKIAYAPTGRAVYSLPAAANSGDNTAGLNNLRSLTALMATMGVGDETSYDAIARLASISEEGGDPVRELQMLQELAAEHTGKANPTDSDLQVGYGIHKVSELWDNLSPYQRSMAVSAIAPAYVDSALGEKLSQKQIPGSDRSIAGPLRFGDVAALTTKGVNGPALARNWNQISSVLSGITGVKDPKQLAGIAEQTGLLGFGAQGASVPLPEGYLKNVGARPAPSFGVGAAIFDKKNHLPDSYEAVSMTPSGKIIGMPKNLVHTSVLGMGAPNPLAYKKAATIEAGKHPAQALWRGKEGVRLVRGSVGGSALVSGLNIARNANPELLGSAIGYSMFAHTLGGANG